MKSTAWLKYAVIKYFINGSRPFINACLLVCRLKSVICLCIVDNLEGLLSLCMVVSYSIIKNFIITKIDFLVLM